MLQRKVRHLERLLGMIVALQGGRRLTARELAQRFGVSVRTVFRDLRALDEIRIPIVHEAGGYRILETFRLRPMQFTPDEVLTLMAALDFARRRRVLGGEAAASAMEKLAAVLPGPQQELAAGVESLLVVDPVPAHSEFPPEVEQALRQALQTQRKLWIRYAALRDEVPTERVVHPYGLTYRGTSLYLIGYCELRQDLRTFRANRIQAARVLDETFKRPADFDLEEYLAGVWGIEDGPLMNVRIRFFPPVGRLILETQWHPTQQTYQEPDGSVILTLQTRGKNELARWVAAFGGAAEVLAPPELRAAVLALGRGIVERYEGRRKR